MADAVHLGEEAQKNRIRFIELQEATEFLSAKQSRPLTANGASKN